MPFRAVVFIFCILVASGARTIAGDWQTIRDCRLIDNEANDGDSFHVKADGEERIFRLYFVDTPEAESGGYVTDRVSEQAKEFGITEEESVEMGKKAAAFTRAVLSRPFKVATRGQNAMGASRLPREYAFVETADGDDLGELLVSRGMARSFGQVAAFEPYTAGELRDKYDRLEARARRQGVGAWGRDAAAPTRSLSQAAPARVEAASEEQERNEVKHVNHLLDASLYEASEGKAKAMGKSAAEALMKSLEAEATGVR